MAVCGFSAAWGMACAVAPAGRVCGKASSGWPLADRALACSARLTCISLRTTANACWNGRMPWVLANL